MQPDYLLLAQTILTEPEHQGIALGAIIVGVLAGILIALGILIPPGIYLWRKLRPSFQELFGSIKTIAASPAPPDSKVIGDGIREAFTPLADSVRELITENKTLRQTADDRAAMNAGLNDRITRLEQQAQKDKETFQSQLTALQQSLTEKQAELLEKTQTIAEQAVQLQELEVLKGQVQALTAEVAQLKAKLQMQEALELKLKQAETERDTEKARADDLAAKLQKAEGELETLRGQLADEKRLHALHEAPPTVGTPDSAPRVERVE